MSLMLREQKGRTQGFIFVVMVAATVTGIHEVTIIMSKRKRERKGR